MYVILTANGYGQDMSDRGILLHQVGLALGPKQFPATVSLTRSKAAGELITCFKAVSSFRTSGVFPHRPKEIPMVSCLGTEQFYFYINTIYNIHYEDLLAESHEPPKAR